MPLVAGGLGAVGVVFLRDGARFETRCWGFVFLGAMLFGGGGGAWSGLAKA